MSHNPYTPPSSHVDDYSAAVDADGNRDVLLACKLIWASFAAGLVIQALTLLRLFSSGQSIMIVAGLIGLAIGVGIGVLINWWVTSKLKRGRNWMRILLTVLAAIGLLVPLFFWNFYKTQVFPMYSGNTLALVLSGLQLAIWLVALGMLHTARSRKWFAAMKQANG